MGAAIVRSVLRTMGGKTLIALLLLCALPAYFLHEALFDPERVLIAADTMAPHPPWSQDWGRARNPELSDHAHAWIPWSAFLADEVVHRGRVPLWNPYQFCGSPALGNPQFEHFDLLGMPLHAAFAALSSTLNAFEWGAWLRLCVAGVGTFLFARRLGRSRAAALLAAMIYAYGGFQVLWLLYPLAHVACWLPWVLWAIDRAQRSRCRIALLGITVFLALAVLGGHPETAFFVGAAGGVFALHSGCLLARSGAGWRPLLTSMGALAAGSLLGAPALLPFLEYLGESSIDAVRASRERPGVGAGAGEQLLRGGLFLGVLWTVARAPRWYGARQLGGACFAAAALALLFCVPDALLYPQLLIDSQWLGDPRRDGWRGPATFLEAHTAYVGAGALLLALCGIVNTPRGGTRTRTLWLGIALLALLAGRGIAPFDHLLHSVPPFSMVELTRGHVLANLAIALLASMGLDALFAWREQNFVQRSWHLGATWVAVGAVVCVVAYRLPDQEAQLAEMSARTDLDLLPTTAPVQGEQILEPLQIARSSAAGVRIRARVVDADTEVTALLYPIAINAPAIELKLTRVADAPLQREAHLVHLQIPDGAYDVRVRFRDGQGTREAKGGKIYWGLQSGALSAHGRSTVIAVLLAAFSLPLLAALARPRMPWLNYGFALLVLSGVSFELWVFGATWNPACLKAPIFRSTPALDFVQARLMEARARGDGEFRIWAATEVLPPNASTGLRLRDVRGYDAIECSRWQLLQQLLLLHPALRNAAIESPAGPSQLHIGNFPVESALFCALGVRYVLDRRLLAPEILAARGLRLVFPSEANVVPADGVYVYEAAGADGRRAFLAPQAISSAEAGLRFAAGDIELLNQPRQTLVLEGDAPTLSAPFTRGSVHFEVDEPDRVVLRLEDLDGEAWLALMDSAFPGWEAEVDGAPVPIETAQIAFRAVRLPAGAQRVSFVYRPRSLRHGVLAAALGIGLALGAAWCLRRQSALT